MRRAVVVKLGSSTLVDGRRRLRRARLSRIASELVALQQTGTPVCVVSSGAIALGLGSLDRDVRPSDVPSLQAASAVGQGLLAGAWQRALASAGGRAAQVLLTADDVRRRTSYLNARATLEALLAWDVVPIVNENDSTATDEITFGDNDALAAQVALLLRARLLVLLTDADGLYTRDPRAKGAELISEVHDRALLAELDLDGASASGLGSGGMRSKVVAASMAAGGGVACVIASGAQPGMISRAVAGKAVGTRFSAARRPVSAWKLWLRYGKPPAGTRLRRRRSAHGAALARREPAAGGREARRGDVPGGRRGARLHARGRAVRDGRRGDGQQRAAPRSGPALGRRRRPGGHPSR